MSGLKKRGKDVLRWLVARSGFERAIISLASLVFAIFVGALIILVSGRFTTCSTAAFYLPFTSIGFCYDPVQIYLLLFNGALGSPFLLGEPGLLDPEWSIFNFRFGFTLKETTLLVFTGLSVAVAFRAGLFNIGTQGQLVVGALTTALTVIFVAPFVPEGTIGGLILVPLGIIAGAVGGGVYGAIPGALKAYADANEVITTIMLNFIAANIAFVLVSGVFRDPSSSVVATERIPEYARLPAVIFPAASDFAEIALIGGLLGIAGLYYLLEYTSIGYDIRTSGVQPEAAEYGGVNAKRTTVLAMTLSGALGGIGGAMWVLMETARWESSVPALGFDGITVSILAGNNPLGVLPAAFLFGVLKGGALEVAFQTDVPSDLVGVLRGLIILFVAMPEFFRMIGSHFVDLSEDEIPAQSGGEDNA
ncbi:ABC transporter permease [Halorubraceae archaeon YAN]|nr:ABC transporter permease [Halorubraceae archaeon YAN]